jgi:sporulation protein YqfC
MKKKSKKVKQALANAFELPLEAAINAVRIVIINNTNIFLENHKGIKEYTKQSIRIRTEGFELAIQGKDMELKNLGAENIAITGEITGVDFIP